MLFNNSNYIALMKGLKQMMNWKGCEKRRSWPKLRYYQGIYLEGLRKIKKTSVRIAGLRAEIGTRDLPNTKQE
jgi:hypothetical protein